MTIDAVQTLPRITEVVAADFAAETMQVVSELRSKAGSDEELFELLKPIEELLCFYEVDPSGVSVNELSEAKREAVALGKSRSC